MIFSAFLASLSHLFFKCKHLFESSCVLIRLIHVVVVVVIHILVLENLCIILKHVFGMRIYHCDV